MITTKPLIISDIHTGSGIPEHSLYGMDTSVIWITLEEHTKTYPQLQEFVCQLQETVYKPKKLRKLHKQKQEKPFWVNDWRK